MSLFEYSNAPAQGESFSPSSIFGLSNEPTSSQLAARSALQAEADLMTQQYSVVDAKAQEVAMAAQAKQQEFMADNSRTAGEVIGDIGVSVAGSLWGTFAEGGTALASLTGNEAAMAMHQDAVAIGEDIREQESGVRKAQRARYDAGMEAMHASAEYQALSDFDRITADAEYTANALLENPALLEDIGIAGITDILGALTGGGLVAKGAGKVAKAIATSEAKEEAAERAGAMAGVAAYEATTGAGGTASQVISEIDAMSHEDLMESGEYRAIYAATQGSEEDKQKAAKSFVQTEAGKEGALSGATLALVAGRITGADKAIADIATKGITTGAKQAVKDTAKETVEETLQSGAEQAAVNVAIQRQDIERDLVEGVGEAAVQGAAGGALASGAVQGTRVGADIAVGTAKGAAMPFTYMAQKRAERAAKEEEEAVPVQPTATEEATAVATEIVDMPTPEVPSEASTLVKQKATDLQAMGQEFRDELATLDPEQANLQDLLVKAVSVQVGTDDLRAEMENAIATGSLSAEEASAYQQSIARIDNTNESTVYAELARTAANVPMLKTAMDTALQAMITQDQELMDAVVGGIDDTGKAPIFKKNLTRMLQGAVLYSSNMLADESITVADIENMAAQVEDPALKARYEAMATLKSMDTVASDVVEGEGDYKGVQTHLRNLETQMAQGKDTSQTMSELENFLVQRNTKATAIEEAIAGLEAGTLTFPHTVKYGEKVSDKWEIKSPRFMKATRDVAAQVRKEEAIVAQAVNAANIMLGNVEPEVTTPEPTVADVEAPILAEGAVQGELDLGEPVVAETPEAITGAEVVQYEEAVSQNPELRNMVSQQFDEEARAEAVTRATEALDLELDELKASLAHRESRLESFMAQGNQPMVEAAQQRVGEAEAQIARLEERRNSVATRADYQFTLENMDWGLIVNAEAMDTAAEQAQNLAEDVLGVIASAPTKRILESQYADQALDLSTPQTIKTFLKDRSYAYITGMLSFIQSEVLPKAGKDKEAITQLLNSSTAIISGTQVLKSTMASLKQEYVGKFDLGLDNLNRFKMGAIAFKPSKLWEDTDHMAELSTLGTAADTVIAAKLKELGFDTSRLKKADYEAVRNLGNKRNWFDATMNQLNDTLNANLDSAVQADYDRNKLRFLLDENGRFPQKFVDAAFLAYVNSASTVGNSFYNTADSIQRMLGLTDESQLSAIDEYADLLIMGTGISATQMTDNFRSALGLKHSKTVPMSVTDSVYSAMGGMLLHMMKADPELVARDKYVKGFGTFTGFTLRTDKTPKVDNPIPEAENFMSGAAKGSGLFKQMADAADPHPNNYVGYKPPRTTAADTHIRSNERLSPKQVEANNIYSDVEWEVDPTAGSFHRALGFEGYKQWKGYVEDDDLQNYNAEHLKTIEGINQQITDSYQKADTLLDEYDDADNKVIYFSHAFSSVRRQQMRGAVNPQGNKYHRILIGHKNTNTVDISHVAKLGSVRKPELVALTLALGQALGVDVDKQGNRVSLKETGKIISDAYTQFQAGEGIYAQLASIMAPDGTFLEEITPEMVTGLKAIANDSDHKMQGVLTVARMFKQAQNGRVRNFRHHMRIEVDGLTNGPAHSTFQNGLAGLTQEDQVAALARGGYLIGNGEGKNTHVQIGKGNIIDSYRTVAGKAQQQFTKFKAEVDEVVKTNTPMPELPVWKAQNLKAAYDFLISKGMTFEVKNNDQGEPEVRIKRNATKNPVTVTVYGGGATGIHRKMAGELREAFAEELTDMATQVARGKEYPDLVKELGEWQLAITGKKDGFGLVKGIKGKSAEDVVKHLRAFTYDAAAKDMTLKQAKTLYGDFITDAIDSVFESNKRSASLMNTSLNVITSMANQMFQDVYVALHDKRVAEGKIGKYDTLSSADVGMLQRKIQEALPYVRTSVGDSSMVATKGEGRLGGKGAAKVRYPTLSTTAKRAESDTEVSHTAKTLGLPGVRAIPVLTISIDASVQVNNHLLQGKHGKYLNVLDAIDHVADKDVRAANEIFNVAEYMGLMGADTLGTVEKALHSAIQAQGKAIDVEGVEVVPNLQQVEINDPDASLTLPQEILRQSLKENVAPIANALGIAPKDVGNVRNLFRYLIEQLHVENNNNRLARYSFIFGNEEVAINQMAGVDNGHAQLVKGEVVLSEDAKQVLGQHGVKQVEKFNDSMARLRRKYETGDMRLVPDSELEVIRKKLEQEEAGAAQMRDDYLGTLTGIWQDMRGTADLNTGDFVYKFSDAANRNIFRKTLSPDVNLKAAQEETAGIFIQGSNAIPSVGAVINDILGTDGTRQKDYLDAMLTGVEIRVTEDLAVGEDGSYQLEGKKRVIKIRKGLTTKEANTVLAHEMIHAITAGGIHHGIRNPKSLEGILVRDLENQMIRAVNWVQKFKDKSTAADNMVGLVKLVKAYKKTNDQGLRELALNEYIAIMGSEAQNYAGFMHADVSGDTLSRALRNAMVASWNAVKAYITQVFGVKTKKGGKELKGDILTFANAQDARTSQKQFFEQDVLAQILKGLGTNGHTYMGDKKLSASDLSNQAVDSLVDATGILTQIENASDRFLRDGFNATTTAIARQLARVDAMRNADRWAALSPADRVVAAKQLVEHYLTTAGTGEDAGQPMSKMRSIAAEFAPRNSSASQFLDELADKSKHAADAAREGTKQAISESIGEKLGDLNDFEARGVMNGIIRTEAMNLGTERLSGLINNPDNITTQVREAIAKIDALKLSATQKNFIINEARSLGYRLVNGGATEGLNLPNAKAIVRMVGANLQAIPDTDGSIEKLVDELATLEGLRNMPTEQHRNLAYLLAVEPEGLLEIHRTMQASRKNIVKQYGVGKEMSLPKGYIQEKHNPNHAIKVVPYAKRHDYSGYTFVREFKRDPSDPTRNKSMALLVSSEGGSVPHVQGAMSTIEAAVGGFTTRFGAASDKSLPSLSGVAAKAVNTARNDYVRAWSSARREPVAKREGMLPNVNGMGDITGYRYEIPNAERERLLDVSFDLPDVVSSYYARIGEQDIAKNFNEQLVDHLHKHWSGQITDATYGVPTEKDFVKIHAQAENPQLAELWRIMPEGTKAAMKAKFGGNFCYVHKRDLDNALGYREWSIQKIWDAPSDSNRQLMVDVLEMVMGPQAKNMLRWAERALQEGVVAAKDFIVVKSIVVPAANIVSNVNHLLMRGIDPVTIFKGAKESGIALREYKANMKTLRHLQYQMEIGNDIDMSELKDLQNDIQNSPINFMVEAGLLSTVMDDVDGAVGHGTVRESVVNSMFPEALFKSENGLIDALKFVTISRGSSSYDALSTLLEAGDFCAKYIQIKESMGEGKTQQEAIDEARVEYINYNTLTSRELDYLNKSGGTFFFKYFMRIQPIILKTIANNPTRALTSWIGADTVGLPSIFDALWLTKDVTATTGAYDLFRMAGGAHPLVSMT